MNVVKKIIFTPTSWCSLDGREIFINMFGFMIRFLRIGVLFWCVGGKTPDVGSRTYSEIMREQQLRGEESDVSGVLLYWISIFTKRYILDSRLFHRVTFFTQVRKKLLEKAKDGTLKPVVSEEPAAIVGKKRGRWDKTADGVAAVPAKKKAISVPVESTWEKDDVRISSVCLIQYRQSNFNCFELSFVSCIGGHSSHTKVGRNTGIRQR